MSKKTLIGGLGGLVAKAPGTVSSAGHRLPAIFAGANNAEAQMRAMGSVGTLFAIVHRTSNATSTVDWRLWRKTVDKRRRFGPEDGGRVEVTKHPALDLWNNPNPFMTRQLLVESVQQHVDLVGEGVIVVYRDQRSSLPLELWPVRPDRITPIPGGDFLAGYIYTGMNGEQVPLGVDEVIHLKMPNPLDPYRGLGPVQAAMVDLDSARYSAEWNRNFFINSAEPGGIIEVPDRLTDDEFKEMTERWREQHQGVAQAHRVAVLEQGKWVDRSMSQKDMQFVQLRGLSREVIRESFTIHGHMLGISQDVNKANAEAGEVSFARWLVTPRAERFKQALNHRLLPMFDADENLEFDHDRVVPDDREADDRERTSKATAAKTLIDAGFDPAEVLAAFELPDIAFTGKPEAEKPAEPAAQAMAMHLHSSPVTATVHIPEQQPPSVTVEPTINIEATPVRVEMEPITVTMENTDPPTVVVNVEPTPVEVHNDVTVQPADVVVTHPARTQTETSITRDASGEITGSTATTTTEEN